MNTKSDNNEYNINAISTVARYAGLAVEDMFATLVRRILQQRTRNSDVQSTIYAKHSRAIETVAKYAGIKVAVVLQQIEHSGRQHGISMDDHSKAA